MFITSVWNSVVPQYLGRQGTFSLFFMHFWHSNYRDIQGFQDSKFRRRDLTAVRFFSAMPCAAGLCSKGAAVKALIKPCSKYSPSPSGGPFFNLVSHSAWSMITQGCISTASPVFIMSGNEWEGLAASCLSLLPKFPCWLTAVWACDNLCIKDCYRQPLASFSITPEQEWSIPKMQI